MTVGLWQHTSPTVNASCGQGWPTWNPLSQMVSPASSFTLGHTVEMVITSEFPSKLGKLHDHKGPDLNPKGHMGCTWGLYGLLIQKQEYKAIPHSLLCIHRGIYSIEMYAGVYCDALECSIMWYTEVQCILGYTRVRCVLWYTGVRCVLWYTGVRVCAVIHRSAGVCCDTQEYGVYCDTLEWDVYWDTLEWR